MGFTEFGPSMSRYAADAIVIVHAGYVLFVVGGLLLILLGGMACWRWVYARLFRYAHLAAIGLVVLESWFGIPCPLTTLESRLRAAGGEEPHAGEFIGRWVHDCLFIDAPPWVFTCVYSLFGLLVLATWWYFPPGDPPPVLLQKPDADADAVIPSGS